jgi:hypothetical protein
MDTAIATCPVPARVPAIGSTALALGSDVALTFEELFEPVSVVTVASLLAEHAAERARVDRIAALFTDKDDLGVMRHFLEASRDRHHGYSPARPVDLFKLDPALAVLNAEYWQRLLATTDIYEAMPQKRRDD